MPVYKKIPCPKCESGDGKFCLICKGCCLEQDNRHFGKIAKCSFCNGRGVVDKAERLEVLAKREIRDAD